MLGAATFVANQVLIQIGTIATFAALLVLAELSETRSRRCGSSAAPARLTFNKTPAILILFMWFWLFMVNVWYAPNEAAGGAFYRIASGVILFLFVITQRYRPITSLQFYSASLITIAAITVALPTLPGGFIACGRFKCNRIDAILQGPFNSGNLMGLAAAMCAALLLVTIAVSARALVVVIFLLVILYATMSRTSFLALGAAVGIFVVDRLIFRRFADNEVPRAFARFTAACVALFPMGVGMTLVFTSDVNAFSNRGKIWVLGRQAVSGYEETGRGVDWWETLKSSGYFGTGFQHFTHSEYLLIYFSGGLVGLAMFALIVHRIAYVAILEQNSLARGAVVPLIFAVCGIIETIWNPLTVDAGTWLFFALVSVVCAAVTKDREAPDPRVLEHSGLSRERGRGVGAQ